MPKSGRLVSQNKDIYTLYGRKLILLPVIYVLFNESLTLRGSNGYKSTICITFILAFSKEIYMYFIYYSFNKIFVTKSKF